MRRKENQSDQYKVKILLFYPSESKLLLALLYSSCFAPAEYYLHERVAQWCCYDQWGYDSHFKLPRVDLWYWFYSYTCNIRIKSEWNKYLRGKEGKREPKLKRIEIWKKKCSMGRRGNGTQLHVSLRQAIESPKSKSRVLRIGWKKNNWLFVLSRVVLFPFTPGSKTLLF